MLWCSSLLNLGHGLRVPNQVLGRHLPNVALAARVRPPTRRGIVSWKYRGRSAATTARRPCGCCREIDSRDNLNARMLTAPAYLFVIQIISSVCSGAASYFVPL